MDIDADRGESIGVCMQFGSVLTFTAAQNSSPASCINTVDGQSKYAELMLPPE